MVIASRISIRGLRGFFQIRAATLILALLPAVPALADGLPECLDQFGKPLPVDNDTVLGWKDSTPNEFVARAHIEGVVVENETVRNRNGHDHFVIELSGRMNKGQIEVVYSEDFGPLPEPRGGMEVEACGDYITSTARGGLKGQYPASPVGAIIHWVHRSGRSGGHPSGFLALDHVLYGYGEDRNPQAFRDSGHWNPWTYSSNQGS